MSSKPPKQIIILGAGVTGIQTALSLLTDPSSSKYKITIIASHTPGDLAPEYTSPWAGGHWRSHVGTSDADREVRDFDQRTYKFWTELLEGRANIGKGEDVGLAFRESRNFWGVVSSSFSLCFELLGGMKLD
jgi:D-amino-acid oxidase